MFKRVFLKNLRLETLAPGIAVALLSLSSPLLISNTGWAQTNTVNVNITQQKQEDIQKDLSFIDDLIKRGAIDNVEELIKYLTPQKNKEVRIRAMNGLRGVGTGAEAALPALKKILQERNADREVRLTSIATIRSIDAKEAIPELISVIDDPDATVSSAAIEALVSVRESATDVVPKLLEILQDKNLKDLSQRVSAAEALGLIAAGRIAREEPKVISVLIQALDDPAWSVRNSATVALRELRTRGNADISSAVPKLQKQLKDKNYTLRKNAIWTLGSVGFQAKETVPDLIKSLEDENLEIKVVVAESLVNISHKIEEENAKEKGEKKISPETEKTLYALVKAIENTVKQGKTSWFPEEAIEDMVRLGISIGSQADEVNLKDLEKVISEFEEVLKITENIEDSELKSARDSLKQQIDLLKSKKTERQFINGIIKNPSVWILLVYLVSLFGMFWLRPLWLLKLENTLKPLSFKIPYLDKEVSLTALLLMLVKQPRVLDAWVEEYIKSVREEFQKKDTVSNRNVYIPVPAKINDKTIAQMSGKDLYSVFTKQRDCVLIQGEGGVGKTSLACQIASWAMSDSEKERLCKHRMIPVLIEEDLDLQIMQGRQAVNVQVSDIQAMQKIGKQALLDAIRGQLQDLTNEQEPISEELLERLLRQRRLLVIVDHFSEMSETTRKAIRPESPDFPVNALIITSRFNETLGHVTKTTIKPLRIEGNRLSSFMEAYLTQQGKRDLFTDAEFFDACRRLSQMVGNRNITALLAKLYADQLVATRVEEVKESPLQTPSNIPDLMLWYLNELNRSVTGDDKLGDRTVQQDTKILAWVCLQKTFRPGTIKREVALAALGGDDAENRLKYLEERLHLIQTIGPAQDQIRFALDPLAEYLAALHVMERFRHNEQLWQQFKQKATSFSEGPDSIKGFLLALHDCLVAQRLETSMRDFLEESLGEQTHLLPVAMAD
ncbi:MAG: HEAT repeat domain-containing protein [Scytonema sp. PMC 1069.18]|nr:HEAT repeat domain-containing protein [Scytonema sp. PMC 1069.18]MEC4887241.1 HEAT repeat domain-containing protein [Scytonema sp. PMC 1070.18]